MSCWSRVGSSQELNRSDPTTPFLPKYGIFSLILSGFGINVGVNLYIIFSEVRIVHDFECKNRLKAKQIDSTCPAATRRERLYLN